MAHKKPPEQRHICAFMQKVSQTPSNQTTWQKNRVEGFNIERSQVAGACALVFKICVPRQSFSQLCHNETALRGGRERGKGARRSLFVVIVVGQLAFLLVVASKALRSSIDLVQRVDETSDPPAARHEARERMPVAGNKRVEHFHEPPQ